MKTMLKVLSLAALLAASAPLALATPLVPGAPGTAPTTTTASGYTGISLGGTGAGGDTVTAATFSANFVETAYIDASGGSAVGCTTTSGCLDFVFSFTNNASSADAILVATMAKFSGYSVDAAFVPGSGAAAPITVSLDTFGAVNWDFSAASPVTPGSTSDTLVLYTNATVPAGGLFSLADGSTTTAIDLGPAAIPPAVPEPSSLMLLGTGLLTTVGVVRRKFKA
jgi:hypothetical protein